MLRNTSTLATAVTTFAAQRNFGGAGVAQSAIVDVNGDGKRVQRF